MYHKGKHHTTMSRKINIIDILAPKKQNYMHKFHLPVFASTNPYYVKI